MIEAVNIINREINSYNGLKKTSDTNVYICCPFHGEKTPSLGIYMVEGGKLPYGSFHCFGCGEKGNWNKLADKLGLASVGEEDYEQTTASTNFRELEKRKSRLLEDRDEIELPFGTEFKDKEWRSISGDLLRELGCRMSYDHKEKISNLIIPIRFKNKLITYIKARTKKKKGKLSYVLADAKHVKDKGLFPYDYVSKMIKNKQPKGVVLVEGPRDALYLLDRGIPALAILGTNMFGDEKQDTLVRLCSKYNLVLYLCMDADKIKNNGIKPGQAAQRKIYKRLKGLINVKKINLEELAVSLGLEELDPASLPNRYIKKIKGLVWS